MSMEWEGKMVGEASLFKIIGVHRKLQIDSQTSVEMFEELPIDVAVVASV